MSNTDTSNAGGVKFSFVVPVYNEQDVLDDFFGRLSAVAKGLGEAYEIIFVDDGSQDETPLRLARLANEHDEVKVVEFSRNFGHQVAVTAGYDHARGRAVVTLDGDCQHPPEFIPQMISRWREGFEVVYTVRKDTDGISIIRRTIGRLAYRIIRAISGVELTDQADFRLLDRKAVDALKTTREHARFVRGLVKWIGFRQVGLEYTAEKRQGGTSSYSLKQLVRMASAGMFNYSLRPLRLANVVGGTFLAASAAYFVVALILWIVGSSLPAGVNIAMLLVGLFGLQFLMLGIIGEYIGRSFDEAKARPLYIVRQTKGFELQEKVSTEAPDEKDQQQSGQFRIYT